MSRSAPPVRSYASLATLLLVLVSLAVTAFLLRERITRFLLAPRVPYQVYVPPPAPDYGTPQAWAALGDPAASLGTADVLLFHPTLYASNDHWNAPLDDPRVENLIDGTVLPELAAPFANAGRLFVPRYRQATLYTRWSHGLDANRARELALRDARAAFRAYLDRFNNGRPFFLVGLGQGGMHALAVIASELASGAHADRFVAAYVLGQVLPIDLFGEPLGSVGLCEAADQTGCVVGWTTVSPDEDTTELRERSLTWTPAGFRATAGRELICVNPLLWGPSEVSAPASMNKGARPVGIPDAEPIEAAVGAQCHNGLLVVEDPTPRALRIRSQPRTGIRFYDTALFWENIRLNLAERLAAFGETS